MKCQGAGGACLLDATIEMYCAQCRGYAPAGKRYFCDIHKIGGLPACGHPCSHSSRIDPPAPVLPPVVAVPVVPLVPVLAAMNAETVAPTMHYANDEQALVQKIEGARNTRRFIFAGETHSCAYDKERTYAIAAAYRDDAGVIVGAERAIFANKLGFRMGGIVSEANLVASSADPARDRDFVGQLMTACQAGPPRPVLILFGDDHVEKVKVELQRQVGRLGDATVNFSHFPNGGDQMVPSAAPAPGMVAVGFCAGPIGGTERQLGSLSKGHFHANFIIKVLSFTQAPFQMNGMYLVYASAGAVAGAFFAHFDTGAADQLYQVTNGVDVAAVWLPSGPASRQGYEAHKRAAETAYGIWSQ